jgi:hypothetical protein
MTNPKDGGARTEVGPHNTITVAMEDLPKSEKIALEKELEEEMAATGRWKLACFQKTHTGVIKETVPYVMTTTTTAPTVTSNLTPEELVKLVDVSVASKYGSDLTQFTRIIILIISIIMMTIHMLCIHVLFFPLIYDAFCPWLCLTVLPPDEVIIHETTPNQVFACNFMICI